MLAAPGGRQVLQKQRLLIVYAGLTLALVAAVAAFALR